MRSGSKLRELRRKLKKPKGPQKNAPSAESISRRYIEVLQLRRRLLEVEARREVRR